MTAAELLRDLASVNEMCEEEREALHALLPLLAGLVEAVGAQQDAVESDKMEDTSAISEPVWRAMMAVRGAWQALNAAAAKEVK